MLLLSLRSRPGAGSFHPAAPDFLPRRSPYEATCRIIASRLRRSTGWVRWPAKPASRLRRMSSSLPKPLSAIPVPSDQDKPGAALRERHAGLERGPAKDVPPLVFQLGGRPQAGGGGSSLSEATFWRSAAELALEGAIPQA